MGDDGQRVEPWQVHGVRRVQRWQRGHVTESACRHVTLGVLPDGRWMVEHSDVRVGCRAWPDEQHARAVAERLTVGEEWREVPAVYDASARPVGSGWVRCGGSWYRDNTSSQQAADQR